MSLEQVKLFYQSFATDKELQMQIRNSKNQEEFAEIIRTRGFNFNLEEFVAYNEQLLEKNLPDEELDVLSEEELMSVVGGAININPRLILIYGGPYIPWNSVIDRYFA